MKATLLHASNLKGAAIYKVAKTQGLCYKNITDS